jgi:hypothetical protein
MTLVYHSPIAIDRCFELPNYWYGGCNDRCGWEKEGPRGGGGQKSRLGGWPQGLRKFCEKF